MKLFNNPVSVAIFFLYFCLFCKEKNQESQAPNSSYGAVTASILRCRKNPSLDSPIVKAFAFGSIVRIGSDQKSKTGLWYLLPADNCWLHSDYLIITQADNFSKLDPEMIACIATEAEILKPIFLFGNVYIKLAEAFSWIVPSPMIKKVEIGNFSEEASAFKFTPRIAASYDPSGGWMGTSKDSKVWILNKKSEKSGNYFTQGKVSRVEAKAICAKNPSGSIESGIIATFYNLKETKPSIIALEILKFRGEDLISKKDFELEKIQCRIESPKYAKRPCPF